MKINEAKEFVSCYESFQHFYENHIKFQTIINTNIEHKLHDHQKRLVNDYEKNSKVILKKFRNGGFCSVTLAWIMWKWLFHNESAIWCSPRKMDAEHTANYFDSIFFGLPEYLRENCKINKLEKINENYNRISFNTMMAARGKGAKRVVIDEANFIDNIEEKWKSIYPCSDKFIIMSASHPDKPITWYESVFYDARNKKNSFFLHETNYKEHPIYKDEKYCQEVKEALGEEGWQLEVLGNIIGK